MHRSRPAHLLPSLLVLTLLLITPISVAAPGSQHLRVDQFGYRPLARKVAVLREPVIGHDAPAGFVPGASIEVVRSSDGTVAFSGPAVAWNGGAVHGASGDRVWWFDFSGLTEEGTFFVRDSQSGAVSEEFDIARDVYAGALRDAVRMYFYQRCGVAKALPHAEAGWTDGACHLGAQQDLDCRLVSNPVASTSRDLSGGWHDAGDYNKYVNYADDALHDLLGAYELAPLRWPDDVGIPESGNGVPDLLDEVRWELDWFLKMQDADGSVLHKISVTDFSAASPPSADGGARRYAPATASATISACGVFARAAVAFGGLGDAGSLSAAAAYEAAAVKAWNWLQQNPGAIPSSYDNAGFVNAAAEDSAYHQSMNRLRAAVYLFRRTGGAVYRSYVDANHPSAHLFAWTWVAPWEQTAQEALLAYADTPGATPSVAAAIRSSLIAGMQAGDNLGAYTGQKDAYRAYLNDGDHVWGSNRVKAHQGLMFAAMNLGGLDPAQATAWREASEGYVHYLHGVNPPGHCYLTNMHDRGAEGSLLETYHAWFADGTAWDNAATSAIGPPPGILVGGVNPSYQPDGAYTGPPLVPPQNQPILKSYRDWNTGWPENSWELTECHIPYQAAYVRLLAAWSMAVPAELSLEVGPLVSGQTTTWTVGGAAPQTPVAVMFAAAPGSYPFTHPSWTVDLALAIGANPVPHILFFQPSDAAGMVSQSIFVPPGFFGVELHFQATQAGTSPHPFQSAVASRTVQ